MGLPQGRKGGLTGRQLLAGGVTLLVVAAIASGLYVAGAPSTVRSLQIDTRRTNDLQNIASTIDSYYARHAALPASLDALRTAGDGAPMSAADPVTSAAYDYRPSAGAAYELCAAFDLPSAATDAYGNPVPKTAPQIAPTDGGIASPDGWRDWSHPAGQHCFALTAQSGPDGIACSLTKPCVAGQTCATIPGKDGAICLPQGHECEAAGCAKDKCVVAESYPAQVHCTP